MSVKSELLVEPDRPRVVLVHLEAQCVTEFPRPVLDGLEQQPRHPRGIAAVVGGDIHADEQGAGRGIRNVPAHVPHPAFAVDRDDRRLPVRRAARGACAPAGLLDVERVRERLGVGERKVAQHLDPQGAHRLPVVGFGGADDDVAGAHSSTVTHRAEGMRRSIGARARERPANPLDYPEAFLSSAAARAAGSIFL